jgi:hypothetical protein
MDLLKGFGGVSGLAKALCSDSHTGLDPKLEGAASIDGHREAFGANRFKETPAKSFLVLVWENFQDPIIILLCFAALVSNGTMPAPARAPRYWGRRGGGTSAPSVPWSPPQRPWRAPLRRRARFRLAGMARRARAAQPGSDGPPADSAIAARSARHDLWGRRREGYSMPIAPRRCPRCWARRCRRSVRRANGSRAWPSGSPSSR